MSQIRPFYTNAYLSVSLTRDVLFPINVEVLLKLLPEAGYVLSAETPSVRPFGSRLHIASGDIARKGGDFYLALNTQRGFLGITGPTPDDVVTELETLDVFLRERLSFNLASHATYYEFLTEGIMKGQANPVEVFRQLSEKLPTLKTLGESLGLAVSLFGVRLAMQGEDPNRVDWFELRVEPSLEAAQERYHFQAIFRQADRAKTVRFARGFTDTLTHLVERLERP